MWLANMPQVASCHNIVQQRLYTMDESSPLARRGLFVLRLCLRYETAPSQNIRWARAPECEKGNARRAGNVTS